MNKQRAIVIDLKALFEYLIKNLVWIIAASIIGGVIGGILGSIGVSQHSNSNISEEIEASRALLTQDEAHETEQVFNQYRLMLEYRDTLQNKMGNSIFMSLNSYAAPCIMQQYLIQTSKMAMKSTLTEMLLGQDTYEKIAALYGENTTAQNIKELVSVSALSGYEETAISNETQMPIVISERIANDYNMVLRIYIFGTDKKHCEDTLSIIEDAINSLLLQLKVIDADFSITKIGSSYSELDNPEMRDMQQSQVSQILQANKNVTTFGTDTNSAQGNQLSGLNDQQKSYFNLLKKSISSEELYQPHLLRKVALGIIFGIVLCCLFFILTYLYNKSLKSIYECPSSIEVLSYTPTLDDDCKKSTLLRRLIALIEKTDSKEKSERKASLVATEIGALIKKNHWDTVFVSKSNFDNNEYGIDRIIVDYLKSLDGVEILSGEPMNDPAALNEMTESQAVLWLPHLWRTELNQLIKEDSICSKLGINKIGAVVSYLI